MKKMILFILSTLPICLVTLKAQNDLQTTIHPLEPAREHYVILKQKDPSQRSQYNDLDTISFDRTLYSNRSILYTLIEPIYLTRENVSFFANNVTPPSNSSLQTRAELDFLLKLQDERTSDTIQRVMAIAEVGYWPDINQLDNHPAYQQNEEYLLFECSEVFDEPCTSVDFPSTVKLLKNIMNDTRLMEYHLKYTHLRPRPYQLDPRLEPLQIMGTPSFASGHTLWAYIQAFTWSELFPSKRKEFLDLAFEIGLSREIMGIHYPSDEEAARNIAHRMLYLMWHNDTFQKDFKAAASECMQNKLQR